MKKVCETKTNSDISVVAHRCWQWIKSETMIIVGKDRLYVDGKGA